MLFLYPKSTSKSNLKCLQVNSIKSYKLGKLLRRALQQAKFLGKVFGSFSNENCSSYIRAQQHSRATLLLCFKKIQVLLFLYSREEKEGVVHRSVCGDQRTETEKHVSRNLSLFIEENKQQQKRCALKIRIKLRIYDHRMNRPVLKPKGLPFMDGGSI